MENTLLFKTWRGIKEKMIFAEKKIERYNIALQMSESLKGVRAAKSSLCVPSLDGLAGAMKVFGFVLLGHAF